MGDFVLVILSFCTTCMDRLNHLKYTMPTNISVVDWLYPEVEFILVDYNSKDGLEEWVNTELRAYLDSGILKYYKTSQPQYFDMSHAKNISHKLALGEILCNLDADNFISIEFIETILKLFDKDDNIILHGTGGANGKICIKRENFMKLGGYNEKLEGWGFDDLDFLNRAVAFLSLKRANIWQFDWTINHDSDERVRRTKNKDISGMWEHNKKISLEDFSKKQYVANANHEWGVKH